jgi:hypothetical protein
MIRLAIPNYRFRLACDFCRVKLRMTRIFCPFCGQRLWPVSAIVLVVVVAVSALLGAALAII